MKIVAKTITEVIEIIWLYYSLEYRMCQLSQGRHQQFRVENTVYPDLPAPLDAHYSRGYFVSLGNTCLSLLKMHPFSQQLSRTEYLERRKGVSANPTQLCQSLYLSPGKTGVHTKNEDYGPKSCLKLRQNQQVQQTKLFLLIDWVRN